MLRRPLLIGGILLPWLARATVAEPLLPAADDLRALGARSARFGAPVVLRFSTTGCHFCSEVRRNYLAPRWAEERQRSVPQWLFGDIDIASARTLFDFEGASTTQAAYASRLGVGMVPVVLVVDARGRPIAEPLVGLDSAGFYDGLLQSRLDAARRTIARR